MVLFPRTSVFLDYFSFSVHRTHVFGLRFDDDYDAAGIILSCVYRQFLIDNHILLILCSRKRYNPWRGWLLAFPSRVRGCVCGNSDDFESIETWAVAHMCFRINTMYRRDGNNGQWRRENMSVIIERTSTQMWTTRISHTRNRTAGTRKRRPRRTKCRFRKFVFVSFRRVVIIII